MNTFVFWQGSLSIHQSALLRNLAASGADKVVLVVWEELDVDRIAMGWGRPELGETRVIVRPAPDMQSALLFENPTSTVHIFSGARGHPMVRRALHQSLAFDAHVGIQAESHDGTGLKGLLRLMRSRYDALRLRGRTDLILAIGSPAVDWFIRSGYPQAKVYPFAYFVETPTIPVAQPERDELTDECFDLVFVGQIAPRKAWHLLLLALHGLKGLNWRLHVAGDGHERDKFLALCRKLGLTDRVRLYGALPNSAAIGLIAKSDLLVLTSRWDGWGAVVSEALMCGVPVVCSDRCGAADLLDGHERGETFSSGSVSELGFALQQRISEGKRDAARSERIREWSRRIDGQAAAKYFRAVVDAALNEGRRPIPPWFGSYRGLGG